MASTGKYENSVMLKSNTLRRMLGDRTREYNYEYIANTIDRFGSIVSGLSNIYKNRDPKMTQEAFAMEYAQNYRTAQDSAKKYMRNAVDSLQRIENQLVEKMYESTGIGTRYQYSGEVRSMLRTMNQNERDAFLAKVTENGQAEYLASVLEVMPEMSGMKPAEVEAAKNRYIRKHAPEFLQELDVLDNAQNSLTNAFEVFNKAAEEYHNPQLEKIALEKQQAADEAKKQFESAVLG